MAPHPVYFNACAKAVEMLDDLPPILRGDPDIRAVIYADAKETEVMEATLTALRAELFPLTAEDAGLRLWETLLRLTVAPAGLSVPKRRDAVVGALRKLHLRMTGLAWQDAVSLLLGTNEWSYREHDPADVTSPDPYVLRVTIPFSPSDFDFDRARTLIGRVTPAHLDIEIVSSENFVLGTSELGVDPL